MKNRCTFFKDHLLKKKSSRTNGSPSSSTTIMPRELATTPVPTLTTIMSTIATGLGQYFAPNIFRVKSFEGYFNP